MSEVSNNLPQSGNTNIVNTYNAYEVADNVLWPLVDDFWRGNFRTQSVLGDHIQVIRSTDHKDIFYVANLQALATNPKRENEEPGQAEPHVALTMSTILTGAAREQVIKEAFRDEKITPKQAKCERLLARCVREYLGLDDSTMQITTYRQLGYADQLSVWDNYGETFSEGGSEDSRPHIVGCEGLLDTDMDYIEAGLYVLNAPKALAKNLERIRSNPTEQSLEIGK